MLPFSYTVVLIFLLAVSLNFLTLINAFSSVSHFPPPFIFLGVTFNVCV